MALNQAETKQKRKAVSEMVKKGASYKMLGWTRTGQAIYFRLRPWLSTLVAAAAEARRGAAARLGLLMSPVAQSRQIKLKKIPKNYGLCGKEGERLTKVCLQK